MSATITDNAGQHRYELIEDGHTAYADYKREPGMLTILYVFAPPELRGSGAAGRLMQGIMEQAKADNVKVTPVCGYAAMWVQRHKEFTGLLA